MFGFLVRIVGNTGFGFCLDDWIFLVFLDCRVSQFFWFFGLSKGSLESDLEGN